MFIRSLSLDSRIEIQGVLASKSLPMERVQYLENELFDPEILVGGHPASRDIIQKMMSPKWSVMNGKRRVVDASVLQRVQVNGV